MNLGPAMSRATIRIEILKALRRRPGGKIKTQSGIASAILHGTQRHASNVVLAQAIDDLEKLGHIKKLPDGGAELLPPRKI